MRPNERWIWLGDTRSAADAGVDVFRAYPGCWFIAYGAEAFGPFDDRLILRATRMACTPCIDGCELGPSQLGARNLSPRRRLQRERSWQVVAEQDLPPSVTAYDRGALEPIKGCCTTFDAMPDVVWGDREGWETYVDDEPDRGGTLRLAWNAHPAGSLVFAKRLPTEGLVVVDRAQAPLA
jgi:hypothetical protein